MTVDVDELSEEEFERWSFARYLWEERAKKRAEAPRIAALIADRPRALAQACAEAAVKWEAVLAKLQRNGASRFARQGAKEHWMVECDMLMERIERFKHLAMQTDLRTSDVKGLPF